MRGRKEVDAARAVELLAAACAKAELCRADLRRKLKEWRVAESEAEAVVERLRAGGYVDDGRYCRAFVRDKWALNLWGRVRLRAELRRRGLPDDGIEEALAQIPEEEYMERLSELLRRRARELPPSDDYGRYCRLARFAAGRGFEPEAISRCLGEIDGLTE